MEMKMLCTDLTENQSRYFCYVSKICVFYKLFTFIKIPVNEHCFFNQVADIFQ